jgi:hypothetical protein
MSVPKQLQGHEKVPALELLSSIAPIAIISSKGALPTRLTMRLRVIRMTGKHTIAHEIMTLHAIMRAQL